MLKKLLTISLMFLIASSFSFAQGNLQVIKGNGEIVPLKHKKTLKESIQSTLNSVTEKHFFNVGQGTLDTMTTFDEGMVLASNNFVHYGQDVMLQWFVAPADLTIKAAGFNIQSSDDAANQFSVRLVKFSWTEEQLRSAVAEGANFMGAYPDPNDGQNGAEPFGENAGGEWVDWTDGAFPTPPWANPDYDLWSDGGFGWPVTPEVASDRVSYQWVPMSNLSFEPTVLAGEIFAVVVINEGTDWAGTTQGITQSYGSAPGGYHGWKYYEAGRNDQNGDGVADAGWWAREFAWNYAVAVELTGDRAPVISDMTVLLTTVDTGPQTVTATITDDNPSGGAAGVATALLQYSVDGGTTWSDVAMTASGDVFTGAVPGQAAGTDIMYKILATDVGGLSTETAAYEYSIFNPTQPNLVIFDGQAASGYPSSYYFGIDDFTNYGTVDFAHDVWAYGAYDESLLNFYTNVFEITTGGPNFYQREEVTNWLAADGTRNYFLAGQEWLGNDNGFTNQTYSAGQFEYDILGVAASYNDVSYANDEGQAIPTKLEAVQGSLLGGALYDLFMANGPTDSLQYDPAFEITVDNWVDGFDPVNEANVDLKLETRGVNNVTVVEMKACAVHNVTPNGNKIAFMSMDPLAINSSPEYYWYGFSASSIQTQCGTWFEINGFPNDVKQTSELVPNTYALDQNYPNPFNPSTVINYSIVKPSDVALAVYDVLGRKVVDLINESQKAGSYQVTWNGLNSNGQKVNSGVYFYTINAGDFVQTRKMMLLK